MDNIKKTVSTTEVPKNFPKGHIMLNNDDKISKVPDLIKLTGQIIEFIEYIEQPEMRKMAKENNMMFKQHVESKFEDFTLDYYSIYRMLIDSEEKRAENIERLFKMIDRLKDVESGKSNMDKEFMRVREELAEEYLYPKFGGKSGFQKAMDDDLKKGKFSKNK